MADNSANNKRVAKNTLLLYVRMLLTMFVGLFTSRVVLNTLGIEDFGIYNVTGGVVTMFSFLNGAMSNASSRYITFAIGKNDTEYKRKVFCTSIQIHAGISLIIILLAETIGLWFLLNKMVIPIDRMNSAIWVYQCSIIASVISLMSVPYNANIVAHEKMSAFAYISVIEVTLKLVIVYLLIISPFDKLKLYAVLLLLVQLLVRSIYARYCRKHFEESKYHHQFDRILLKEMSGFAGWSFVGNFAYVLYTQGLNIILNIFFGPIVNAARGIAVQVQSIVSQFVTNFQMALNPQITKNYASGNMEQMYSLMFRSARFSFLLLFFVTLPILLETDFVLTLWLKNVPENTVTFTRIIIITSLVYTIANPCIVVNQATGHVKVFQVVEGGILLLILPISYIALKFGAPAYSVFIVHFCIEIVAQFLRMILLHRQIGVSLKLFFTNVYKPITLVILFSCLLPVSILATYEASWCRFIIGSLLSVLSVFVSIYFFGLSKGEKKLISEKLKLIFYNI